MTMNQYWILAAILLPIIGGIFVPLLPFKEKKQRWIYIGCITVITSLIVWKLLLGGTIEEAFQVIYFVQGLSIGFKIDGLTMVFAGLVSVLWPLATLYAFEYMEHDKHESVFFMFYSMSYGVTLGIAFASDLLSMFFFYELLTLTTVPLVIHTLSREAIHASRKYLYYSMGGAAFALIGLIFIIVYGETCEFMMGGVLTASTIADKGNILLWIYLLAFMGFGVKAAIWPLSTWLPEAGVAPTPVTALLHAVAVVKAGVFAIIRLTYYCFGTEFLRGTWVQYVVMAIAIITVVYGSGRAVKEPHVKRRFAYSTVSNLSYVIFGVTIMTPLGLAGALSHMICHAVMKICLFMCAGAFIHQTGKSYIYDMDGCGRKMPVVFGCLTISGLGLMGVPGLAGFISKWQLAKAAIDSESILAYLGVSALLLSALLTSFYMLTIVVRAFFPKKDFDYKKIESVKDPGWKMCVPLFICAAGTVALGFFSRPLIQFFEKVALGLY